MENTEQTQQQLDYLNEQLERATAYEELMTRKGFTYLKAFYENTIRAFSNKSVQSGFKDMEEYNLERGKVLGLMQMFNDISSSIKVLEDKRKEDGAKPEQPSQE